MLGIDTNDAAQDYTFAQSWAQAQSVGIHTGTNALDWGGPLPNEGAGSNCTPGALSGTMTGFILPALNGTYTSSSAQLTLTIRPINGPIGGTDQFPSDLTGLAASNANVICRFNKFVDSVLGGLGSVVFTNIMIGNEIDTNGSAGTAPYWSAYSTFFHQVAAHVRSAAPGVKVGFTVTLAGAAYGSATIQSGIQSLLPDADLLGVTYYPLDPATTPPYGMKQPSVVAADFSALISRFSAIPISVQEVGYASQGATGCTVASQANQAQFVSNVFAAWDANEAHIPFMSFLRMNDWSNTNAANTATAYGLGSNACFIAYLQYLGFRTDPTPSANKPAWTSLSNETHARGWW
jgi:exo-beta-1,3-glucanase (GH17 family)